MSCADDPAPLSDEIVSARAARLCKISEDTWRKVGGEAPVYIVGTEVPVPGGPTELIEGLTVTSEKDANATIAAHKKAFEREGIEHVWPRVIGLVVQPGVEFDHHNVIDYRSDGALWLSKMIESEPHMVYETHSTDYQTPANLRTLVRDHFAILKVGPGLTFALREALWALDQIESEWIVVEKSSNLKKTVLSVMAENPVYWKSYYSGSTTQQKFDCQYSLSDRIRYYWPDKKVLKALSIMEDNFENNPPPLTLISQYLPEVYHAIRNREIENRVEAIIIYKVSLVLDSYFDACKTDSL